MRLVTVDHPYLSDKHLYGVVVLSPSSAVPGTYLSTVMWCKDGAYSTATCHDEWIGWFEGSVYLPFVLANGPIQGVWVGASAAQEMSASRLGVANAFHYEIMEAILKAIEVDYPTPDKQSDPEVDRLRHPLSLPTRD